jgi:hypothetical protein
MLELCEKLVALIPLPKFHLTRYFGIIASRAADREKVVPSHQNAEQPVHADDMQKKNQRCRNKKYIPWAELLRKVFLIDVLKCGRCSGKMIIDAVIEDAAKIKHVLEEMGRSADPPKTLPARPRSLFVEAWDLL